MAPPQLLLLDVNETLSDLSVLGTRLDGIGAPSDLLDLWFASTLRDGFAVTMSGAYEPFLSLARSVLVSLLSGADGLALPADEAADHVLAGWNELPLHPDVGPALERLRAAGTRLVTLSNGSSDGTRALLDRGGAAHCVEECLSVDDVGKWKPAPETYAYAAHRTGVPPEHMTLAAVHPWDVAGAQRAGLRGTWINRTGVVYPPGLPPPDAAHPDFGALAASLCPD